MLQSLLGCTHLHHLRLPLPWIATCISCIAVTNVASILPYVTPYSHLTRDHDARLVKTELLRDHLLHVSIRRSKPKFSGRGHGKGHTRAQPKKASWRKVVGLRIFGKRRRQSAPSQGRAAKRQARAWRPSDSPAVARALR